MGLNLGGGFARGVLQGQSIFQSFHDQYERGQQKRDLAEIASAKTEDSVGFTPEQGQQINELAANGYKIDFDAANKAYTAKNDSGDTKTIAMGGVTDFMGKRTTRVSEDAARINAMADVFGRTDPFKATQLRSQARREERDRIRDSREDKQWARDDALLKIDEEMGRTFQNSLKNADGTARVATADDHLANMQQRISRYSGAGFSKEAEALMREHYSMANVKLQMEGKERENAATKVVGLLDAGDPSGVVDYYNKYMPTGDKLTGVEVGKDGSVLLQRTGLDGKPGEPLRAKSIEDLKRTIVGSVDYKQAYQISQDMFRNNLSLKQDARADNADTRSERQLNEQIRHNRAQEGIASARVSAARGAGADGGINPLAGTGFNAEEIRKQSTAQALREAEGNVGKDGKPMSGQQIAARAEEIYSENLKAATGGVFSRQLIDTFTKQAAKAQSSEDIEGLRALGKKGGMTDEVMAKIDPRFAPAKQAAAPTSVRAGQQSPVSQSSSTPSAQTPSPEDEAFANLRRAYQAQMREVSAGTRRDFEGPAKEYLIEKERRKKAEADAAAAESKRQRDAEFRRANSQLAAGGLVLK